MCPQNASQPFTRCRPRGRVWSARSSTTRWPHQARRRDRHNRRTAARHRGKRSGPRGATNARGWPARFRVDRGTACRKSGRGIAQLGAIARSPIVVRAPRLTIRLRSHQRRSRVDRLARTARRRRLEQRDPNVVIGHFDWRIENLSFNGAEIVGIYDWDSVASAPETFVVGVAAASFTADWSTRTEPDPLPSVSEMRSFVNGLRAGQRQPIRPRATRGPRCGQPCRLRVRCTLPTLRRDSSS